MARKGKGKQRKDTFYHKAKIAGFRARSAYKLLQLNSKYEILQRSRVCVDLCAAPGSWMQVAKKYMPLSSIIVGVDLFPIKPIHGAISIVGDITTEKARQDIKGTLKTWKADLVLHDGSPKVGQNWLHDAYQQNLLVLHSFKLACELLQKGGWFITKVFRSKDFFNLEYVFRKLFKKVETTKPQASRYESAEIFVVCQGYLDPAKVDPQFFSAKHVFQEIKLDPTTKLNLLKPEKSKPKAEGYSEGATTLYNKVPVSEFMKSPNFVEVLQGASELDFDDEAFKNHPLTTQAIIENCKDIKLLGRKDLRLLLNWRKSMRADYKKKEEEKAALEKCREEKEEEEKSEGEVEEEELDKLQKQILELRTQQAQDEKRVRKRKLKERRKLEEKLRLKAVIPGDVGPTEGQESGLFNLTRLAQVQNLDTMVDQDADMVLSDSESEGDDDRPTHKLINKDDRRLDKSGRFYLDGRSDEELFTDSDSGSEEEGLGHMREVNAKIDADGDIGENADASHPLITDLVGDNRQEKRARKAENWFSQDVFNDLETEADEDMELEAAIAKFKAQGGLLQGQESKRQLKMRLKKQEKGALKKTRKVEQGEISDDDGDGNEDGDYDSDDESEDEGAEGEGAEDEVAEGDESGYTSDLGRRKLKKKTKKMMRKRKRSSDSEGGSDSDSSDSEEDTDEEEIQHGPQMPQKVVDGGIGGTLKHPKKKKKGKDLDAVGLSLATQMIYSKKAKRDIMDGAWNRYMTGDGDDLPSWFAKDEKKFNQLPVDVEPEDLRMYRDRSKDVNARTIKKVVEAKARKQRRVKKRLERARKKSEHVTNNAELSEREKAQEVKKLYKKAMDPLKKKETAYVVMKKRMGGHKPKGTKGPYKLVDKRLKKDARGEKAAVKRKGGKTGGRGRGKKR